MDELSSFNLIVDAVFGFSFNGAVRAPFDNVLHFIKQSTADVISIDIPSGWHVEQGNIGGEGLNPKMLVSLTAPKLCAQFF